MLAVALVLILTIGHCSFAATAVTGETVNDVIIGHNKKGPYTLSWTEVDVKSIVAIINGRTLKSGDYSIDNSKGMLSFSSVLLQDAIVRFTYRTTAKSQRTAGAVSVPVTLKLLSGKDTDLQVTGLHVQADPNNPNAAKTIVGLTGERKWTGGKVNSQILMSQDNAAKAGEDVSALDKAALKLGGETQAGAFKFTGSLLTVGTNFSGEKEYGVAAGRQESGFAVQFKPGNKVEASASLKSVQDNAGKNMGASSTVQEQKVIVSPTDATKVVLSHSTTSSQTAAAASGKVVETSTVSVDQRLGSATTAAVSFQNQSVNAAGAVEDKTTQRVVVTSKPSDRLGVTAQVQQQSSDATGDEVRTSTSVQANPLKQVSIAASHSTVDSSKTGNGSDTSVTFKATPLSNMEIKGSFVDKSTADLRQFQRDISMTSSPTAYAKVSAVFSQKGLNDQEDTVASAILELTPLSHTKFRAGYKSMESGLSAMTITDFSASSKPLSFLEIIASHRDREARQEFAPDSTAVQLALAPSSKFSVRASYQANPEDTKGQVQDYEATTAGVKVRFGSVGLSADLSHKEEAKLMQRTEERILGLEMPAFGRGKLTTGYRTSHLFGAAGSAAETFSLGYRHNLGADFNISLLGNYTQRRYGSSDWENREFNAEASVGIRF